MERASLGALDIREKSLADVGALDEVAPRPATRLAQRPDIAGQRIEDWVLMAQK